MVVKGEVNVKVIASPSGIKVTQVTAPIIIRPFNIPITIDKILVFNCFSSISEPIDSLSMTRSIAVTAVCITPRENSM